MRMQKRQEARLLPALIVQAAASALLAAGCQAAVLANIDGLVQVNHGDGFKPASINTALVAGDRVRVSTGSADVLYENGCPAKVRANQTVVVLSTPPACTAGGLKDGVTAVPAPAPGWPFDAIAASLVIGTGAGVGIALANTPVPSMSP